ncbi:hypothetical protein NSR02_07095 [Bacillus sp. FSL W8-1122]
MSDYYKEMPNDFRRAIDVIKGYCQNENCQEHDCFKCPFPLSVIRCGDATERAGS